MFPAIKRAVMMPFINHSRRTKLLKDMRIIQLVLMGMLEMIRPEELENAKKIKTDI